MNKKLLFLTSILFLNANFSFASLFYNIDLGINEFQKTNYKNAKKHFLSYINSNPNDEDGYFWLAKTYQKLSDSENATNNFKKSYELTYQKKELEKINFDIENKDNIEDYFDMAIEYFGNANYKEADFYADMMLKINPKSASAYFIKAKIAKVLNNEEEARSCLNQAIIFNNSILNTNLAKTLKITKIPNTTKEIYKFYAFELYYKGEIQEAINNAKKYLELDKKNIDMVNFLVNLYLKTNNKTKAKRLISQAKEENIKNIQTLLLETKVLDNKDEIEKTLKEAYKINPNNQDVLLYLGNFYLKKEDFINSKTYFENLTLVNNELYEGYFGLIYSLIKLNELEKASALIRQIDSINKNSSETSYLLALVYEYNKEFNEALEYLNQAISKDENPNYYFEKAKIFYILKDYDSSYKNLQKAKNNFENLVDKDEYFQYFIKVCIKLNKTDEELNSILNNSHLDKERIIYKYNLYNLCKLKNSKINGCLKNFKPKNPTNDKDYVDIAEINLEKKNITQANKTVTEGLKKYPNSDKLIFQKIILDFYSKEK